MHDSNEVDKNNFIYQHYQYQGHFTLSKLLFNANLQEFSQRVSYICNLQTTGKISLQECYEQIEELWEKLTLSFKALGTEKDETKDC
jgi:hypothetical protein